MLKNSTVPLQHTIKYFPLVYVSRVTSKIFQQRAIRIFSPLLGVSGALLVIYIAKALRNLITCRSRLSLSRYGVAVQNC
jgi:hypothetical protein